MTTISQSEQLITENLGLVHACANRFRGRGVEYEDLFQAGCVGLIKAASGFDRALGYRFSTYAVPAILGEIRRIFRETDVRQTGRNAQETIPLAWEKLVPMVLDRYRTVIEKYRKMK